MSRLFDAAGEVLDQSFSSKPEFPITLSVWYSCTSFAAEQTLIMFGGTSASQDNSQRIMLTTGGLVRARSRTTLNSDAVTSAGSTTTNVWYHACCVFAAAASRAAYFNGGSKGTETTSRSFTDPTYMSVGKDGGGNQTAGRIAHVAVWDTDLNDNEVLALAQGVSPLIVRPQRLWRYFPYLGRDTSDIDIINGTTLTTTGATYDSNEPPQLWVPRRTIPMPVGAGPPAENKLAWIRA